ncbi:MAG TPA: DedA family protein [Candidatus Limnocylindria bacterium]|nr:DedA family protein [Candidatus Limnocylindria bacterium]
MRELIAEIARGLLAAVTAHAYVTLFFAIAVEEAGVPLPVPGDLIIAYYGWRAAGDPSEVVRTILTCAAASTAGTQVPYWLARRFGRSVTERLTGWLDIDMRRVEQLLGWVDRHGFYAVLGARLVPGFRVAVALVAGTARVPPLPFAAGIFVAGAIYWTLWVLIGATIGPHVADVIRPAYRPIFLLGIPLVVIAAFVGRLLWARSRRSTRPTYQR